MSAEFGDYKLTAAQINKKFKHAEVFGVAGNPNRKNIELFKDKIIEHINDPSTILIKVHIESIRR